LIFDLDGTLADPMKAAGSSVDYAFRKFGLEPPSEETLRACIGPPFQQSVEWILGEKNRHLVPGVLQAFREHHDRDGLYHYEIYPGCREALERLAGPHRLFVATSKHEGMAIKMLRHYDLDGFFDRIAGADLPSGRHEKGDVIRHLLSVEKIVPRSALMIGDRKFDVVGAREHGIETVGVLWGFGTREELAEAGARQIVATWDELISRL
jgi:phosphoglycolate phosphatase